MVVRLKISGLESSLLAVVEANGEGDLGDRATSEVTDAAGAATGRCACRGGSSSSGRRCSNGVVTGSGGGGGRGTGAARDRVALVIDSSDAREVRGDAEDRVEEIGLDTGLGSTSVSGGARALAGRLCGRIGATGVREGVANELGDDVDVLRGAVVERLQVGGLESCLLAVVETNGEGDLGDRAAAEVANAARAAGDRVLVGRGAGSGNRVALIVDRDNIGEVGRDAKRGVEEVSLLASLRCAGVSGSACRLASGFGSRVRATRVRQSVADELSDDIDALG